MYTWYFLNRKSGTETNPIEYVSKLIVYVLQKVCSFQTVPVRALLLKTSFGFFNPRYFSPNLPGPNAYLLLEAFFHTKFLCCCCEQCFEINKMFFFYWRAHRNFG